VKRLEGVNLGLHTLSLQAVQLSCSMRWISKLPKDLLHSVLRSWLTCGEVGRFDSATCSVSEREHFLSTVTASDFAVNNSFPQRDVDRTDLFVKWLMKRGIAISELPVTTSLVSDRTARLSYLQHTSKHIRSINIRWVDGYAPADVSTAIEDLFSNCPDVLVITHQLDGVAVNQLMSVNPITVIATHCHRLVKLYKRGGLNDDDLVALGNGCPLLASVGTMLWSITDVGLQGVARNGALSTLRLQNCCKLTDEGLRAAAAFCPHLESVDLSYCTQLSDASLIALGQHCHNLRELNIQGTSMTDEGLLAIAAGCLRLVKLVAKQNDIGPAIEAIARSCPRLRTLVVTGVEVATEAVLALAECCPLLEELGICGCEAIGTKRSQQWCVVALR
jgi:hypothetical protein